MILRFTVPGEPVAKGRPRFTRAGRSYTPTKTERYENLVRMSYVQKYGNRKPAEVPLQLSIRAIFPIPKSWSKKKRAAAEADNVPKISRPDLDNVLKAVADGLNGVAWTDDSLIYSLEAWKGYGTIPRVEVIIWIEDGEEVEEE